MGTRALMILSILASLLTPFQHMRAALNNNPEINIFLPNAENDISVLSNFEKDLGVKFNSVKFYLDWSDNFPVDVATRLNNHGAIPEVTWQPQIGVSGIAYSQVLAGKYDTIINNYAKDVKSLPFPIRINLAPEMNGDWESWGFGNNGNNTTNFKQFWQYVVQKFRNLSVSNVQWIWAPNVHYGEPYRFADYFPGDSYVDFMGLDGYNWGTSQSWSTWQSFRQVFGSSYADMIKLSSKPIYITEVASTELGGNKASWIHAMFADLRTIYPQITGFTWFNMNKETDWRIESSVASKQAFISEINQNPPPPNRNDIASIYENTENPNSGSKDETWQNSAERIEKVEPLAMIGTIETDKNDNQQISPIQNQKTSTNKKTTIWLEILIFGGLLSLFATLIALILIYFKQRKAI